MKKYLFGTPSNKGLTLVEIIASLALLSIIILSIIPLFIHSAQANKNSKETMDATLLAQTELENIVNINDHAEQSNLEYMYDVILQKGYKKDETCENCLGINKDGHYIIVQLKNISKNNHPNESPTLGKIVIKVYQNDQKLEQESQMELVIPWKK